MAHREQQPEELSQPIVALGQMVAGIAAMQRDQAETNPQFLREVKIQEERQDFAIEQLAARTAAAPPLRLQG